MAGYFVGIDIGSTMTKVVLMNGGIIASILGPTGPEQRRLAHRVIEPHGQQGNRPVVLTVHAPCIHIRRERRP